MDFTEHLSYLWSSKMHKYKAQHILFTEQKKEYLHLNVKRDICCFPQQQADQQSPEAPFELEKRAFRSGNKDESRIRPFGSGGIENHKQNFKHEQQQDSQNRELTWSPSSPTCQRSCSTSSVWVCSRKSYQCFGKHPALYWCLRNPPHLASVASDQLPWHYIWRFWRDWFWLTWTAGKNCSALSSLLNNWWIILENSKCLWILMVMKLLFLS